MTFSRAVQERGAGQALGNLTLQPVEKLGALNALCGQFQCLNHVWLRAFKKRQQLHNVQRHIAVARLATAALGMAILVLGSSVSIFIFANRA